MKAFFFKNMFECGIDAEHYSLRFGFLSQWLFRSKKLPQRIETMSNDLLQRSCATAEASFVVILGERELGAFRWTKATKMIVRSCTCFSWPPYSFMLELKSMFNRQVTGRRSQNSKHLRTDASMQWIWVRVEPWSEFRWCLFHEVKATAQLKHQEQRSYVKAQTKLRHTFPVTMHFIRHHKSMTASTLVT